MDCQWTANGLPMDCQWNGKLQEEEFEEVAGLDHIY